MGRALTRTSAASAALVIAAGISAYLLVVSRAGFALAGCGVGGHCAGILHSRWGAVGGAPVSAIAIFLDVLLLLAIVFAARRNRPGLDRLLRGSLFLGSLLLIGSAAWFVGIQVFTRQFCPWCLSVHVCDCLAAGMLAPVGSGRRDGVDTAGLRDRFIAAIIALAAVGALAAIQTLQPDRGTQITELPIYQTPRPPSRPSTVPARTISEYAGRYTFPIDRLPLLGSANESRVAVILFDYSCPHCRQLRGMIEKLRREHPGELAIVALPMPLCADCNIYVPATPEGFEHSCAYARLALEVALTDPAQFPAFDRWMWSQPTLPAPAQAQRFAETLVGGPQLQAASADPVIKHELAIDMELWADNCRVSKNWLLPQVMAGTKLMIGLPTDPGKLRSFLAGQTGR